MPLYGELILLEEDELCVCSLAVCTYRRLHQTLTEHKRVVTPTSNGNVTGLTKEDHDANASRIYSCIAPKQSRVLERKPVLESNVAGNAIG